MKAQNQDSFYVKQTGEGTKVVQLNNRYELKKDHEYYDLVEFLVSMIREKEAHNQFDPNLGIQFFSSLEFQLGGQKMQQKCTICQCEFEIRQFEREIQQKSDEDVYALPCSHIFHLGCLKNLIGANKWAKCPVCSSIFGRMMGDMPDGNMTHGIDHKLRCEGYPVGTIVINYHFNGLIRKGASVPGTSRTAYLPDNPEGRQVLELLKQCWERKLTFTVGRSVTLGRDNMIVWNGIHHKTSTSGGSASFGYPDPTYLKRVKEELAAKGIVPHKNH